MSSSTNASAKRKGTIAKALAMRTEMNDVRARLANSSLSLADALLTTDPDSATSRLYVVKLLESLPGVGKVQARRVMSEIGITEKFRVAELGANHRTALLKVFGQ